MEGAECWAPQDQAGELVAPHWVAPQELDPLLAPHQDELLVAPRQLELAPQDLVEVVLLGTVDATELALA